MNLDVKILQIQIVDYVNQYLMVYVSQIYLKKLVYDLELMELVFKELTAVQQSFLIKKIMQIILL